MFRMKHDMKIKLLRTLKTTIKRLDIVLQQTGSRVKPTLVFYYARLFLFLFKCGQKYFGPAADDEDMTDLRHKGLQ